MNPAIAFVLALELLAVSGVVQAAASNPWKGTGKVPGPMGYHGPANPAWDQVSQRYRSADWYSSQAAQAIGEIKGTLGRIPITIETREIMTSASIAVAAKGLARFAGPIGLGITVGQLVWDAAQHDYNKPTVESFPGDPQISPPVMSGGTFYRKADGTVGPTEQSVCPAGLVNLTAARDNPGYAVQSITEAMYNSSTANATVQIGFCNPNRNVYDRRYCPTGSTPRTAGAGGGCSWPIPCPANTVRTVTGSCATGGRATDAELEAALKTGIEAAGQPQELVTKIQEYDPAQQIATEPMTSSGPASLDAGSTSTTVVEGANTTIINNQETYNLTYQGDQFYNQVTTTTTTTVNNGPPKTETTTTGPNAPEQKEAAPLECGSIACEETLQKVKTDTGEIATEIKAASAPTLPDQSAAIAAARQADLDLSNLRKDQITAELATDGSRWFAWVWTPPVGSCTAPQAVLAHAGGAVAVFDYCPFVNNIRALLGWLFAMFGAWSIYGTLFRGSES